MYVCPVCSYSSQYLQGLRIHISRRHKSYFSKYKKILKELENNERAVIEQLVNKYKDVSKVLEVSKQYCLHPEYVQRILEQTVQQPVQKPTTESRTEQLNNVLDTFKRRLDALEEKVHALEKIVQEIRNIRTESVQEEVSEDVRKKEDKLYVDDVLRMLEQYSTIVQKIAEGIKYAYNKVSRNSSVPVQFKYTELNIIAEGLHKYGIKIESIGDVEKLMDFLCKVNVLPPTIVIKKDGDYRYTIVVHTV